MLTEVTQFFSSNHLIALLVTSLIFLITIILVTKRWVGFSGALIMFLISLIVGILINNPQFFSNYNEISSSLNLTEQSEFKNTILQSLDEVRSEVKQMQTQFVDLKTQVEENHRKIAQQSVDLQKFIETTEARFVKEKNQEVTSTPTTIAPTTSEEESLSEPGVVSPTDTSIAPSEL